MSFSENKELLSHDTPDSSGNRYLYLEKLLSRRIQDHSRELSGWASGPSRKAGFHEFIREVKALGGGEGIAIKLYSIANRAGGKKFENAIEHEKSIKETTTACLNLFSTIGVVSGLIISVVFGVALTPLNVSVASENFFSDNGILAFTYVYVACLALALSLSLANIWLAVKMYLFLSVWMVDASMKTTFMTDISLVPLITSASVAVSMVATAFPFGMALTASPGIGLLTFCIIIPVLLFVVRSDLYLRYRCLDFQYEKVKEVLHGKKEGHERAIACLDMKS